MNEQVVGSEVIEEENTSQYAEGVYELIQEIFNVEIEINNNGTPITTRSRTRSDLQKGPKNTWSKYGEISMERCL